MYAQVSRSAPPRGRLDELLSALREEPGFVGLFDLVDRRRGEEMVIVLWETAEQASRARGTAGDTVWEVNARV